MFSSAESASYGHWGRHVRLACDDRIMLTLYRRHLTAGLGESEKDPCPYHADRYYERCKCPMWVEGTVEGVYRRHALKVRSWNGTASSNSLLCKWHRAPPHPGYLLSVSLLKKGVPLEVVSELLGHASTTITKKHYAPWVKERQDLLESAVQKTWEAPKETASVPIPVSGSSRSFRARPSSETRPSGDAPREQV